MLAIANLSSILNKETPSPTNSITEFKTSSLLKLPHKATITSLPVTPGDKEPFNSTLTTGGTCHQVLSVAQIAAASVLTE